MTWIAVGLLLLVYTLYLLLRPARYLKPEPAFEFLELPNFFVYSFQVHIHTQFSYDSLGKQEDIRRDMDKCNID